MAGVDDRDTSPMQTTEREVTSEKILKKLKFKK